MNTVASTFGLLCIFFITCTAFACDDESCNRFCSASNCASTFDCGQAKTCVQGCLQSTCPSAPLTCKSPAINCTQLCNTCTNVKLVCSSPRCEQFCTNGTCEMECSSSVKTCIQVCQSGSTCKLTCHDGKTDCQVTCEGANCTGLPEKPKTKNLCDELTGNCTKTCTGECGKTTLSCDDKFKECHLSCEKGCKMVCGKTVEKCFQTCVGDTPCVSVCQGASCKTQGKFRSPTSGSAIGRHLNNFMFVLIACTMIFQIKNI